MSTRHYLTTRLHGDIVPGPVRGPWNETLSGARLEATKEAAWVLSTSKTDGGRRTSILVGETNDTAGYKIMIGRWATVPLTAQTISGTLNIASMVERSPSASNAFYYIYAYIAVGLTSEVRHVLLDYHDTAAWNNVETVRALNAAQSLTSGATVAGDRVIVEIGVTFDSNSGADAFDTTAKMYLGTLDGSNTPYADGVVGATTQNQAYYLDWSYTFVEATPPAAPANDACADATVISAVPYSVGPIDTTQSADTDKAVWWSWTPNFTGRAVITTLQTNYSTQVHLYTGGCGVLSNVSPVESHDSNWLTYSQSAYVFNVTSGTPYLIKVTSVQAPESPPLAAKNSGGSLTLSVAQESSPTTGDLILDSQFLAVYRDGVLVKISDALFGNTPTASAIDNSLRPMNDANGGTNTQKRLYVGVFGSTPYVDIFNVADLGVGRTPFQDVNLIYDALQDGGKNISSIVFDPQGRLLIGYFGDNYSVLGSPPSNPLSAYVRRVDGIAGLDDPGPAATAEIFHVEFENSGSDYIDVTADGNTLFYTSAGRRILRFDLANNVQLSDFALLPVQSGVPRPGARGLRLLGSTSTAGLIVAYGDRVLRLDSSGNVIQTYIPTETDLAQNLDKVELIADRTQLLVSDQLSTNVFRFDLETGEELERTDTGLPAGQLCGFSIDEGFRAGVSPPTPPGGGGGGGDNSIPCCSDTPPSQQPDTPDKPAGPPGNPGDIEPPIVPAVMIFECEGGGTVQMAPDYVPSELWA